MDIVRLKGGLGNQMFQYAFAESLRAYGRDVRCNLGFYRKHSDGMPFCLKEVFPLTDLNEIGDDIFNEIDLKWIEIKKDKNKLLNFEKDIPNRFFWVESFSDNSRYIENVFNTKDCVFVGYWQSEKYFKNISARIQEVYTFQNINNELRQFANRLNSNYYGVHIRRSDYLKDDLYSNICTKDYYLKAMDYILARNKNAKFIFFSDDIEWVYQNLYMEGAIYGTKKMFRNYQNWYDMYLMSQCCGNIIANSSFSWWGAWLNQNPNKIVIAPKRWLNGLDAPDIWCDEWIRM